MEKERLPAPDLPVRSQHDAAAPAPTPSAPAATTAGVRARPPRHGGSPIASSTRASLDRALAADPAAGAGAVADPAASAGGVADEARAPSDEISLAADEFTPTPAVADYLAARPGQEGEVRVAFGTLARGIIRVRSQPQGYATRARQSVPLTIPVLQPLVDAGVRPVLAVTIARNAISGFVTIERRGGAAGNPADLLDWIKAHTSEFGWVGLQVPRFPRATNHLSGGRLLLRVEDFRFELGGWVHGTASFGLIDDALTFSGTANVAVPGLVAGATLDLERNAEGGLRASTEIPVAYANFSGNLIAEYADGTLAVEGTVGYRAEKFSGRVTLLVTDAATARNVARERLGPEAIAASAEAAGTVADARGPRPGPRALAGYGVLDVAISEWLTGTAQVIIDGQGHLTVVGEIRPPAEVELFAQRDYVKEILALEVRTLYGVPLVGNVFLFANIGLAALAKLGPGRLYDIVLLGTYSTDPAVLQHFGLSASLGISAFAGLRLRAEGGAGVQLAKHDIKAGVGLAALAGVRGYVEARPTIGYRETADPEQGKLGEYYLKGRMELAAQPFLGLSGDLFVELDSPWWSPAPDKTWSWPLGSLEYPLPGELGIAAEVDYVIGSPELPEIEFAEVAFDSGRFMTDLLNDEVPTGGAAEQETPGAWQEGETSGAGELDPAVVAGDGSPAAEAATGRHDAAEGEPPAPGSEHTWLGGLEAVSRLGERSRDQPFSQEQIEGALARIAQRYGFTRLEPRRRGEAWDVRAEMNPFADLEEAIRGAFAQEHPLAGVGRSAAELGAAAEGEAIDAQLHRITERPTSIGARGDEPLPEPVAPDVPVPPLLDGRDLERIERGQLLDLTGFDNRVGVRLSIPSDYVPPLDRHGRTNAQRTRAGLSPVLPGTNERVELHHTDQSFFSVLHEVSAGFHRSVHDDVEYHPMSEDPGYASWRSLVALYRGELRTLGSIYNLIRRRYWYHRRY